MKIFAPFSETFLVIIQANLHKLDCTENGALGNLFILIQIIFYLLHFVPSLDKSIQCQLCANTVLSSRDTAERKKRKFCSHEVDILVIFSSCHFGFVLPYVIIISNLFFFFSNFKILCQTCLTVVHSRPVCRNSGRKQMKFNTPVLHLPLLLNVLLSLTFAFLQTFVSGTESLSESYLICPCLDQSQMLWTFAFIKCSGTPERTHFPVSSYIPMPVCSAC